MAETQREHVPLVDSGELDTALAFLTFARHCVVKKTEGLDDEQLRRVLVGSGTSLLGLVHHVTVGERYWFGRQLAGRHADVVWDFGTTVPAGRGTDDVLTDHADSIRDSDAAIRAAGDPDATAVRFDDGGTHMLRWLLAHMTSETARHAGHADILREQIDGTTGR